MERRARHLDFLRMFQRFQRINPIWNAIGMPRMEFFTLECLWRNARERAPDAGMNVSALIDKMEMSPPAMSRLLRSLEEGGHIRREIDPADRRNTLVYLTESSELTWQALRARFEGMIDRIYAEIGSGDMETLLALLGRLLTIIESEVKEYGKGDCECSKSSGI